MKIYHRQIAYWMLMFLTDSVVAISCAFRIPACQVTKLLNLKKIIAQRAADVQVPTKANKFTELR